MIVGAAMAEVILQTKQLKLHFGGLAAIDDVDFSIEPGELVAIIGPNGAGKTTFVNLISGGYFPDDGTIMLRGDDVTRVPTFARSWRGLARSFQITSIFPEFSVLENVAIAAQAHAGHSFRFWKSVARDAALHEEAMRMLVELGLESHAYRPAAILAHGEKRLLEIAMALVSKPQVVLLDEPTAGLGSDETRRMSEFIGGLKGKFTILLIEHDMEVVFALADRIFVLAMGAVVASGPPERIRNDPSVRLAYLGDEEDV
jgi:branched-chain amino acid transport system ATP-binding protein